MERKKVNQSQAREAIYRVLMNSEDECLSVSDISNKLTNICTKKISINTVYRHLRLFVSCKLIVCIQDDFKKTYYSLRGEDPLAFTVCTKCNHIEKCTLMPECLMDALENTNFITIHKKCQKCVSKTH